MGQEVTSREGESRSQPKGFRSSVRNAKTITDHVVRIVSNVVSQVIESPTVLRIRKRKTDRVAAVDD